MNIRFPDSFEAQNGAATIQDRARRLGSRPLLILGIAALAVALAVWLLWGFLFGPVVPKKPPPPVLVTVVQQHDMTMVEHTIGTVVANATVQLTARVQGELLKANFKEGDTVKAGQLLFQIDPRPYQALYNSAAATLASAKGKADRYARLMAQHAIAPQDADDARAAYLEAMANLQTARLNLDYTQIRSPIDGKTGPILIQPGNMVMASAGVGAGASATATTSTTLVVITQIQPVKISFSLPQADLPRVQERARANALSVDVETHGGGARLSMPVDFVGNAVDDKTGTIELRATFPNTDGVLVPGQLVDVGVTLNAIKQAIVVPHEAINLGPKSNFVYVIKDGNAQMLPVKVLYDNGTSAAIEAALKPGDQVITDGQLRVVPGKPVEIVKAGAAEAKPATP